MQTALCCSKRLLVPAHAFRRLTLRATDGCFIEAGFGRFDEMHHSLSSVSKFLSLILRHKPELISLELDSHGWAEISTLIHAANQTGRQLDLELLLRVVHENDKQRFAISEDGTRIRANQGALP